MRAPRSVRDADVAGKTVLVRSDLNVPLEDGRVADDTRIRASLPTLELLLERGAAEVRVCSHLGRPKTEEDRAKYAMAPVAERLRELLPDERVHVLENTRFDPGETATTRASRASSPRAATSTSTTPSARPTARMPRPRRSRTCCPRTPGCCCSPSSSTSAGCSARSSGRSCSSPAARRWRTSSACCATSAAGPTPC